MLQNGPAYQSQQYSQNLFGGSLKSKVYTDFGIILPNCGNPYYVQIMQDIGTAFHGTQYAMMPECNPASGAA